MAVPRTSVLEHISDACHALTAYSDAARTARLSDPHNYQSRNQEDVLAMFTLTSVTLETDYSRLQRDELVGVRLSVVAEDRTFFFDRPSDYQPLRDYRFAALLFGVTERDAGTRSEPDFITRFGLRVTRRQLRCDLFSRPLECRFIEVPHIIRTSPFESVDSPHESRTVMTGNSVLWMDRSELDTNPADRLEFGGRVITDARPDFLFSRVELVHLTQNSDGGPADVTVDERETRTVTGFFGEDESTGNLASA